MGKPNQSLRGLVAASLLLAAAAGCASGAPASRNPAIDDYADALSADQLDCERTKRACLVTADCDPDQREACESAFRACDEPLRAERDKLHDKCRGERETCEASAADEAARHACHIAEHKCTLPVEPPEAQCRIDAEECVWQAQQAAGATTPPAPMTPPSAAEEACHDQEKTCRDAMHLDPADLPKPPDCGPPAPPPCKPGMPGMPGMPVPPPTAAPAPLPAADMTADDMACERTKRECLIAADCAADKRDACESAFRACDAPIKAARDEVHDMCRTEREKCEAAAADDAARHACHMAEHKCTLPVEPPDAVCHIDAEECRWNAHGMTMTPPPAPPAPPAPGMMPMPPDESPEDEACRETEKTCVESKRMKPEDLPEPPHCAPAPPACKP